MAPASGTTDDIATTTTTSSSGAAPNHYAYPAVPPPHYMPYPPAYGHYEYSYEYNYQQYYHVAGQHYIYPHAPPQHPAPPPSTTTAAEASPPEPAQPAHPKIEIKPEPTLTPGPAPSQPLKTSPVVVEDELDEICPVCDSECTCGTKGGGVVVPKPSSTLTTPTPGSFGIFSARRDPKGGRGAPSGAAPGSEPSGNEPNGSAAVRVNKSADVAPLGGDAPAPPRPAIKIKVKPLSIPASLLPPTASAVPATPEKKKRGRPTKAAVAARKEEEARQRAAADMRERVGRAAAAAVAVAALLDSEDESSLTELEEADDDVGGRTPRARRDSGESNESGQFPTFVSAFTSSTASDTNESTEEDEEVEEGAEGEEEMTEMGEDTELEAEEERAIVREQEQRERLEKGEGKRRRWAWQKERKDRERRGDTVALDAGEVDGVAAEGGPDHGEEEEDEDEEEEDDDDGLALGVGLSGPPTEQEGWHTPTSDSEDEDEDDRFLVNLSDFSDFSDSFWGSQESGSDDGSSSEETDYDDDDEEPDLKKPLKVASVADAAEIEPDGVEKGTESDAMSTLSELSIAEAKASGLYDVNEDDPRSPFLKPRKFKSKKSPKNKSKSKADHSHPKSKSKDRAKSDLRREKRRRRSERMPKMLLVEDGEGRLVFGGEWEMEDAEFVLDEEVEEDAEVELMELFRSEDEKDGAEADAEMDVKSNNDNMPLDTPFSLDQISPESESSSEWSADGETTDEDDVPGLRPAEAELMFELGLGLGLSTTDAGELEVVDPLALNSSSDVGADQQGTGANYQGYPYSYPYMPYVYDFPPPPPPPPAPVLTPAPPAPALAPAPALTTQVARPVRPLPSRARATQTRLPTMAVWAATAPEPTTPEMKGTAMVVVVDGKDASGISPFAKIRKGDGLNAWAGGGTKRRRESSSRSDASWYYSNSKRPRHEEPPSSESAMTGPLPTRELSPSPDPLEIDDLLDTSYFLYDESIPSSAAEEDDEADTGDATIMRHLTRLDSVPLGQWFRRARAQGAEVGMEMGLSVTAFAVDHEGDDTLLGPPDFTSGGRNLVVVSPIIFPSRDGGYTRQRSPSPITLGDSFSLAAALSPRKAAHSGPNKNSRKEKRREKKRERMAMGIDVTPKARNHKSLAQKGRRRIAAF